MSANAVEVEKAEVVGLSLAEIQEADRVVTFQYSRPCGKLNVDNVHQTSTTEIKLRNHWRGAAAGYVSALCPQKGRTAANQYRFQQRQVDKGETPMRTITLLREVELESLFLFLSAENLRRCLLVSKAWGIIIRNHPILSLRRSEFEWSGHNYDARGILYYFGTVFGRRAQWTNPSKGVLLDIKLLSSSRVSGASRRCSARGIGERLENVVSHGVTHYSTDGLPCSWVAIDFGRFAVSPTHYTIGTSTEQTCFPTSWQLLGCEYGKEGELDMWNNWVVLDEVRGVDPPFCATRLSATFSAKSPAASQAYYRYLRVMQVGANQQFGNNFLISGIEFYGHLQRRENTKAVSNTLWG